MLRPVRPLQQQWVTVFDRNATSVCNQARRLLTQPPILSGIGNKYWPIGSKADLNAWSTTEILGRTVHTETRNNYNNSIQLNALLKSLVVYSSKIRKSGVKVGRH